MFDEAEIAKLGWLVGTWSCQLGSTYYVIPDEDSGHAVCTVKTVRPNGDTRVTKALIRASGTNRNAEGRVTFGLNCSLGVDPDTPDVIHWINKNEPHKSYEWWRMEEPAYRRHTRFSTDTMGHSEEGWDKVRVSNCSTRDSDPKRRWTRASGTSTDCSDSSNQPLAEEQAELRRMTLSLREASSLLRECHDESRENESACKERMTLVREALVREVSSLAEKRDKHVVSLKRCHQEQHSLKRKLRRCRKVVEETVASVDDIFAEAAAQAQKGGNEDDADFARRLRRVRKRAMQAEADATALLTMQETNTSEEDIEETDPDEIRASMLTPPRRKGHPVNCFDGCSESL